MFRSALPTASHCQTIVSEESVESVLLVEDDVDLRTTIAEILRRESFYVIEASDGESALDLLRTDGATIEWLITDIRLRQISGLHVAFEFRHIHSTKPIVVISGYELPPEIARMTGIETLQKPFSGEALLEVMQRLRSSRMEATLGM